jgi:hypothetical protein
MNAVWRSERGSVNIGMKRFKKMSRDCRLIRKPGE